MRAESPRHFDFFANASFRQSVAEPWSSKASSDIVYSAAVVKIGNLLTYYSASTVWAVNIAILRMNFNIYDEFVSLFVLYK